jgi:hypothetical protein
MDEVRSTRRQANEARGRLRILCEHLPGISGFGVAWDKDGNYFVRVNVSPDAQSDMLRRIPRDIDGVPVQIQRMTKFALEEEPDRGKGVHTATTDTGRLAR